MQAGGSDQWGNITAGHRIDPQRVRRPGFRHDVSAACHQFGREIRQDRRQRGMAGRGATSPYQFYQYWIRTDDRDVERFLKLFTFLTNQEIAELCASPPEQRAAQKKLAAEVTRIVHGEDSLALAMKASEVLFGGDMTGLRDRDLEDIFADVPSFSIVRSELDAGMKITDALVRSGAAKSKGEATRLIAGGGVYLNNIRVSAAETQLRGENLASESMLVLRVGKKNYYLGKVS